MGSELNLKNVSEVFHSARSESRKAEIHKLDEIELAATLKKVVLFIGERNISLSRGEL